MCLHDRYFDAFGGPAAWIESVTAECREKLAPLFQLTAGERAFLDAVLERGEIDASSLDVPEAVRAAIEASPGVAMESAERQGLEIRRQVAGATHEATTATRETDTMIGVRHLEFVRNSP